MFLAVDGNMYFYLFQNSVLAIPKAQWDERELKPFGINGNIDVLKKSH